jgi:two-component system, sporulation sensor kinase A
MNKQSKTIQLCERDTTAERQEIIFAYKQVNGHLIYSMYDGERLDDRDSWSEDSRFLEDEWVSYEDCYRAWEEKKKIMYEVCKDDKVYIVRISPVRQKGQLIEMLGHCLDITEYKRMEEELKATKELCESLINHTTGAMAVADLAGRTRDISRHVQMEGELKTLKEQLQSFICHNADAIAIVDLNGNTLQINPAFEEIFGWTYEEVVGRPFPIIPKFLRDSVNELHEKVKSGEQMKGFETVRQRKDGGLIDVSVTLFMVKNMNDEPFGLAFVYRDITDRKIAEAALRESEERYRSLVELSPEAIVVHREGKIDYINPAGAKMIGNTRVDELLGKSIIDFVHPDYRESVRNGLIK